MVNIWRHRAPWPLPFRVIGELMSDMATQRGQRPGPLSSNPEVVCFEPTWSALTLHTTYRIAYEREAPPRRGPVVRTRLHFTEKHFP